MGRKKKAPLSLRAYARRRGVSAEAVSKAVVAGRLKESVVLVGGAPKIADPDLADREWDANTRPRVDHAAGERRRRPHDHVNDSSAKAQAESVADTGDDEVVQGYYLSRARREAAMARKEAALADMAEIDVLERKGELVSAATARASVIDKFTVVKTRILGVPSRVAQRLPHIAPADVQIIDDFLREALEELADGGNGDRPA